MSDFYVRSLLRLSDEYDAVDASLNYVQKQWRRQNLSLSITRATSEDLQRAINDLQSAYVIRLFSTFEGMLKQHMVHHHPNISVKEDAPAVWLIDRVANLQSPQILAPSRERVHKVRQYRNFLVHPGGTSPSPIEFTDALARLNKFRRSKLRGYCLARWPLRDGKPVSEQAPGHCTRRE